MAPPYIFHLLLPSPSIPPSGFCPFANEWAFAYITYKCSLGDSTLVSSQNGQQEEVCNLRRGLSLYLPLFQFLAQVKELPTTLSLTIAEPESEQRSSHNTQDER